MKNSVRFLLGTELREEQNLDPTMTVLQYLRTVVRRTGTKEGCAEGDCGACTVVVGELVGDSVRYRTINSCILFIATLDGKQLLTVEDLRAADGSLHPVQQAMVDCHGSQCGFCTPGFVMSLWALLENGASPTRSVIDEALAGNLCRCTGYDAIVRAAFQVLGEGARRTEPDPEIVAALKAITPAGVLSIETGGRRFIAPGSLDQLMPLLAQHPDAVLLGGGTDVGLWVTKQLRVLDTVIYLGNISELKKIEVTGSEITLGAGVSLTDSTPILAEHFPALEPLFQRFGSPPIRNSGTIGGNIANGSPIGDSMPPLIALKASVLLRRDGATREMQLDEFFVSYQETALEKGEILEAIKIPIEDDILFGVYKVSKRKEQDISAVCGAFAVRLDGTTVAEARVAFGGMAAIPRRAVQCEKALLGNSWTLDTIEEAAQALDEDFSPLTDMRGGAAYRRLVTRNLLLKFFHETSGEAVNVFDYEVPAHA